MPDKEVWTVVGTAELAGGRLFEFGDVDGKNGEARLQHPLGVAWHDGLLYVADTYNNKVKVIDPDARTSTTLLGDTESGRSDDPPRFDEPAGLSIAGGRLYVADTNNHAIRVVDLKTKSVSTLEIAGLAAPRRQAAASAPSFPNAQRIMLDSQELAAGSEITLMVAIDLPIGMKLNDRAPIVYQVENRGDAAVFTGDRVGKAQQVEPQEDGIAIKVKTMGAGMSGTVRLSVMYYVCHEGSAGICEVRSVVCDIPVKTSDLAETKQIEVSVPSANQFR
jgi:hypothetical protein